MRRTVRSGGNHPVRGHDRRHHRSGPGDRASALLEDAGQDPADNALVPFGRFSTVHFARFFILPASTDSQGRSYTAVLDLSRRRRRARRRLCPPAGRRLPATDWTRIFQHCQGYRAAPGCATTCATTPSAPRPATSTPSAAPSSRSTRRRAARRDPGVSRPQSGGMPNERAATVRAAIQEFVEREPSPGLGPAERAAGRTCRTSWARRSTSLLVGIAGIVLFPAILLGAAALPGPASLARKRTTSPATSSRTTRSSRRWPPRKTTASRIRSPRPDSSSPVRSDASPAASCCGAPTS